MTNEEILQQIYDETLVGNKPAVVELTARGIEAEMDPNTLLFEALIPALEEVGAPPPPACRLRDGEGRHLPDGHRAG